MPIQESLSETQVFLLWKSMGGSILVSGLHSSIGAEVSPRRPRPLGSMSPSMSFT